MCRKTKGKIVPTSEICAVSQNFHRISDEPDFPIVDFYRCTVLEFQCFSSHYTNEFNTIAFLNILFCYLLLNISLRTKKLPLFDKWGQNNRISTLECFRHSLDVLSFMVKGIDTISVYSVLLGLILVILFQVNCKFLGKFHQGARALRRDHCQQATILRWALY